MCVGHQKILSFARLIILRFIFDIFKYVGVSVWVRTYVYEWPQRPEELGLWELKLQADVDTRNQSLVLWKSDLCS